jgi:hypothetical protein
MANQPQAAHERGTRNPPGKLPQPEQKEKSVKTSNGDPARLEISQLGDRISFRFSIGTVSYIVETEDVEEARRVRLDLSEAALRISTGSQNFYFIPAKRKEDGQ